MTTPSPDAVKIADGIVEQIAQRGLSIDDETWEFAVAEITAAIDAARREENEECARMVEDAGEPYALHTAMGAVVYRTAAEKIAASIRSRLSPPAIAIEPKRGV